MAVTMLVVKVLRCNLVHILGSVHLSIHSMGSAHLVCSTSVYPLVHRIVSAFLRLMQKGLYRQDLVLNLDQRKTIPTLIFPFSRWSNRLSQDMVPNSDPEKDDPYFALFTMITFCQTMILFFETVVVLAIWNSQRPLHWFLKCSKPKELSIEKDEKQETRYKVMRRGSLMIYLCLTHWNFFIDHYNSYTI